MSQVILVFPCEWETAWLFLSLLPPLAELPLSILFLINWILYYCLPFSFKHEERLLEWEGVPNSVTKNGSTNLLIPAASVSPASASTFSFEAEFPCSTPICVPDEITWVSIKAINETIVSPIYPGLIQIIRFFQLSFTFELPR